MAATALCCIGANGLLDQVTVLQCNVRHVFLDSDKVKHDGVLCKTVQQPVNLLVYEVGPR